MLEEKTRQAGYMLFAVPGVCSWTGDLILSDLI